MKKVSSGFTESEVKELLAYARSVIEHHLTDRDIQRAPDFDQCLKKDGACFVTLTRKDGGLRGCIGNILPFEPLGKNIARNAINAAFNDPRFPAVINDLELAELDLELSILSPIKKVSSYKEIEIGKHGIILRVGNASAVFLPQVAPENGWDLATTLTYLAQKAGLPGDAWQAGDAEFDIFTANVYSEKDND